MRKYLILVPFLVVVSTLLVYVERAYAQKLIKAPHIQQMPELPRGCEVTSLAMLLQHAGVKVDKMTLAKEIKKVPFQKNGLRGSLHQGFVGNMYTFDKPGLGVYHEPIVELGEKYIPGIIDLSGNSIDKVYEYVDKRKPVWVIHNSWFSRLPASQFYTWQTIDGKLDVTYRMHSVIITGYDEKYVYVNDPLHSKPNRAVPRKQFEEGWVQMGSQAITYVTVEEMMKSKIKGDFVQFANGGGSLTSW